MEINEDRLLDEIAKQNIVIFLVLICLSLLWTSWPVTLGVITGGVISVGAYTWLHASLKKVVEKPNRRAANRLQITYFFRLLVIGLLLYLTIAVLKVNPVALCFGLSVVVFSIVLRTLRFFKQTRGE